MNNNDYSPMSSEDLLKRGRCCKSSCLHCPYGHTLKKLGLKFIKSKDFTSNIEQEVLTGDDTYIVTLKDHPVASMRVNHIVITEYKLFKGFESQGLDKEVVESYFFY